MVEQATSLGGLESKFNLFLPPFSNSSKKAPILYYLAGMTSIEDTG